MKLNLIDIFEMDGPSFINHVTGDAYSRGVISVEQDVEYYDEDDDFHYIGTTFRFGEHQDLVAFIDDEDGYSVIRMPVKSIEGFIQPTGFDINEWEKRFLLARLLDYNFEVNERTTKELPRHLKFNISELLTTSVIRMYNQKTKSTEKIGLQSVRTWAEESGISTTAWQLRDSVLGGRYIFNTSYDSYFINRDYLWNPAINKTKLNQLLSGHSMDKVAPLEILNYSSKVEQYIKVEPSNALRFGIELELENASDENIQTIHDHLKKHCIMKRDGSLSNGVEIVSVPATIAEHKEVFKNFFDAKHSLKALANCGIHIHVTREKLSFLAIGRLMKFISENKDLVYKISGRQSESYAKVEDWGLTTPWYSTSDEQKYKKNPRFQWSKYTGLNIAPSKTIEFRLFKSTTDFKEFCRFLEFTESLIHYCTLSGDDNKGKMRKIDDMFVFDNYKAFVSQRGKSFPNLNKFLVTI